MKLTEGRVLVGAAGRATELLHEFEATDPPDVHGTIGSWFLQCPGQSPAWQHFNLNIIYLRDIPGVKPAFIHRQGATHEIQLVALDPQANPTPLDMHTWRWLTPVNLVEQLILPSDEKARWLMDHAVEQVINHGLWAEPPLSGQVEPWRTWLRSHETHCKHGAVKELCAHCYQEIRDND